MRKRLIAIYPVLALLGLGIMTRLLPHPPNATAVGAIALKARQAYGIKGLLIPLAVLGITDSIIGFYNIKILLSVYGSFVIAGLLGIFLKKESRMLRVGTVAIGGSLIFFLITNAAVWMFSPWYDKTIVGLLQAYALGLPFLGYTIAGDTIYSIALLKGHACLSFLRRLLAPTKTRVQKISAPVFCYTSTQK